MQTTLYDSPGTLQFSNVGDPDEISWVIPNRQPVFGHR